MKTKINRLNNNTNFALKRAVKLSRGLYFAFQIIKAKGEYDDNRTN